MADPLKVLAISYEYPPMFSAQSIQISRILPALDAEVRVVCALSEEAPKDESIGGRDSVALEEVRYPMSLVKKVFREACSRTGFFFPLRLPDLFITWFPRAYAACLRVVESFRPDVLVSFGMPMSDHLLGYAVKRKTGIPWLAHFSDPWADNPFIPFDGVSLRINRAMERKVMAACDRVLFTSSATRSLVMSKYPAMWSDKAGVVPHAFDQTRYAVASGREVQPVIRYLGAFYPPRTPRPLLEALRVLLDSSANVLGDIRFELVGPLNDSIRGHYRDTGLPEGLLTFRDPVSYQESLELMCASRALLVIDAPDIPAVFFPSKLVDYIGAGRPILGLCDPEGTSGKIIRSVGGRCARSFAPEDCADLLRQFLERPDEVVPDREAAARYAVDIVAGQFLGELKRTVVPT